MTVGRRVGKLIDLISPKFHGLKCSTFLCHSKAFLANSRGTWDSAYSFVHNIFLFGIFFHLFFSCQCSVMDLSSGEVPSPRCPCPTIKPAPLCHPAAPSRLPHQCRHLAIVRWVPCGLHTSFHFFVVIAS